MTRLVVIADDLTGAADAGVCFAHSGFSTLISFAETPGQDMDVLVRSTQSRDVDVSRAIELVEQAVRPLVSGYLGHSPQWVYAKIDSALRGHPREELNAIMSAFGERRALIAPALPSEQRTTVGGRQFIAGVPLEASAFGADSPVSDLNALFALHAEGDVHSLGLQTVRQGLDAVSRFLRDRPSGIVMADAETDADLHTLACAGVNSGLRILGGSAGLARQLARVLPVAPEMSEVEIAPQKQGPILIVAGSQHRATARQIETLRSAGYPIVCLDQTHIDEPTATLHGAVEELVTHLVAGRPAVLTTAGLGPSAHGPTFVVERLAEAAVAAMAGGNVGGLVLTGGEVAYGILNRLGATAFHLRGEIRPAIPWGIVESPRFLPMHIATKAGSFGAEDALLACAVFLASETGTRQ